MQILIADDHESSRMLIRKVLKSFGYDVLEAEDGEEAWELFQAVEPRLLISDWLMPGMDGTELIRKIRSLELPDYTYCIMLTGNVGKRESYLEAMEAGVDDFLVKPLDRIQLELRLRVAERILKANSRIQSLENVLTVCAYTKQIHFPEEGWQTLETFMRRHLGIRLSHGIEPRYYEEHIKPELLAMAKANAEA